MTVYFWRDICSKTKIFFLAKYERSRYQSLSACTRACAYGRKLSNVNDMEDNFALRYVHIYPGVNSRVELETPAPGLRPEQRIEDKSRTGTSV